MKYLNFEIITEFINFITYSSLTNNTLRTKYQMSMYQIMMISLYSIFHYRDVICRSPDKDNYHRRTPHSNWKRVLSLSFRSTLHSTGTLIWVMKQISILPSCICSLLSGPLSVQFRIAWICSASDQRVSNEYQ